MRNLVLIGERRRSVQIEHESSSETSTSICDLCHFPSDDGTDTETVLLTCGGDLVRATQDGKASWVCHLNEISPGGKWFDVSYVDSIDALVCLSHGGGIVTVSPATGQAELVGEFDHGLEAGQWSPDGEVLLLATFAEGSNESNNSVLLTMNGQWEVLSEVTVEPHVPSSNDDNTVLVCWRPDGTTCAVSTVDVHDNTRRIRTYQRDTLALDSIGRSEDGSGKVVPNLIGEGGLAWASGGCSHVLTAVQRKSKRTQQVVFFEPNGLRHREFVLRPDAFSPQQPRPMGLTWNVESNLLAVTLREATYDKVQLWHRSNYHWYLKQELRVSEGQRVSCTMFHEEQPYLLFVGLYGENDSGTVETSVRQVEWREFEFRWDPSSVAVSVPESDSCTAMSIDGCTLNVIPLEKALVPPPMYAASLTMDQPIRSVAFSPESQQPVSFVLQLSGGDLVLLGSKGGEKSCVIANYTSPAILSKVTWTDTQSIDVTSLRNFLIMGSTECQTCDTELSSIAICCPQTNGSCEQLVEIFVEWTSGGDGTARVTNSIPLAGQVLRMISWSDSPQGALLELDDGMFLEYNPSESGEGAVVPSEVDPLLEPCPWLAAIKNASNTDQRLVVGLSSRSRLYCHDRLLADAVSSFILSPTHKFLCFATTGSHCQLRFLPLSELLAFDPLMGSDENHLLEGYEPRNVERGTRLVAILPSHPTAILQLPRGNMEGVYPRALVLPYVMSKIDLGEYGLAFEMMRKQRVDLNLIVDMRPWHFLEDGVEKFVDQVQDIEYLNLFIATLKDFGITEWKYKVPEWFQRESEAIKADLAAFDFTTKVNQVCRRLREIMIQRQDNRQGADGAKISDDHFLLPILSTFAKENPPQLENALTLIKQNALLRRSPGSKKPPLFSETAQGSIKYLAFLADYELLFATALGMYDFELARAVARNSQMDPKVYLPLLKRLKALDTYYGRYEVDLRLKRYEMALSNLFQSGANMEQIEGVAPPENGTVGNGFEQCLDLIEEHKLHRQGLELYSDQAEKRHIVMKSLGERLLKENRSESALAIFLAAEPPDLDGAKRAARMCGDWRYYFTLTMSNGSEGEEANMARMRAVASEVAEEIATGRGRKNSKRSGLAQAGRILLDYGHDVIGAVDMFIAAEMWSEGRRIACLHSRQDLVKKCVDSALSFAQTSLGDFEDRAEAFTKANNRYEEVLKIRKEAARNGGAMTGDAIDEAVDDSGSLFSMASNASNTSLRSNLSSGSVGSVSSVSSVISVGAVSSFSITSERDINKHKSKFNKIGKQKKSKKKKSGKKKMKPGSEEELNSLVGTLKANCVYDEYRNILAETIQFLAQVGKLSLARELYDGYNDMKDAIRSSQQKRIEAAQKEKEEGERMARKEGQHHEQIVLKVECEVDSLRCEELPEVLHEFFSFL